jgi:GxxExxY protein
MMELQHQEITEQVIGAAFEVHNVLGYGFLEMVYKKAMQAELISRGFRAAIEHEIFVYYKKVQVGYYKADLFVNDCVIVELKIAKSYSAEDEAQLLNELKATGIKVGLLINFGRTKVEFKRMVF